MWMMHCRVCEICGRTAKNIRRSRVVRESRREVGEVAVRVEVAVEEEDGVGECCGRLACFLLVCCIMYLPLLFYYAA